MKKFTCLLFGFLCMSSALAACPSTYSQLNGLQKRLEIHVAGAALLTATNGIAGTCGYPVNALCCDDTRTRSAVAIEINKIKTQFTNFGSSITRIGGMMSKISILVNSATASSAIDSATSYELSGATTSLFKAWALYTPAQFESDFLAYKSQLSSCFDYYSASVQKIACSACLPPTADSVAWIMDASIPLTQASCNDWVYRCNRVWAFMHKLGWFVQVAAFLNKRRDTSSAVTYIPPAASVVYAAGASDFQSIDFAVSTCSPDPSTATCPDTYKSILCKAFIGLWSDAAAISVGRSDTSFMQGSYNPTSTVTRRLLPAVALTGAITITPFGVDTPVTNTLVFPPTATISTIDTSAWWSGYVSQSAPSTSSSSDSQQGPTGSQSENLDVGASFNFNYNSFKSDARIIIAPLLAGLLALACLN